MIKTNKLKKAIIKLSYKCNNNCVFCHAIPKRVFRGLTQKETFRKIDQLNNKNIDIICLSGGEPTIRKDIINIADYISQKGFYLGLITNGRMLSNPNFLKKLISRNLKFVYVSLHGYDSKMHNEITKSEASFAQTLKGIKNCSELDIIVIVNCVVVNRNINSLIKIIKLLKCVPLTKIKFSYPNPIYDSGIISDINLAAKKIKEAINYGSGFGLNIGFEGIPFCLMKGYTKHINNLKTNKFLLMSEVYTNKFFRVNQSKKTLVDQCLLCKDKQLCEGIDSMYLRNFANPIPKNP